jgi:hypothetical protein
MNESALGATSAVALSEQEISRDTLLEKYAKGKETSITDVRRRVARALAQVEAEDQRALWEKRFLQAQEEGFIPAGRINSAAGVQLAATLINCFVQPVGDSISETVDGRPGIYIALQEAAETMRRGGGVGYDFSRSAPRALKSKAPSPTPAARCPICACLTAPAKPWNQPARAAARRWPCCVATIRMWRNSSTPSAKAASVTST